jgi:hypothetical protein
VLDAVPPAMGLSPVTVGSPAPAPPTAPVEPPKPADSTRLAQFAAKESEIQKKTAALKAERAELDKRAADLKAFDEFRGVAAKDPAKALAWIESHGLTYDLMTQAAIARMQGDTGVRKEDLEKLKADIAADLEKKQAGEKEAAEKARAEAQAATIKAWRAEVEGFVAENAATYELTALHGASNLVADVIEEHFQRTSAGGKQGKILSNKEACELVEKHLEEQVEKSLATTKFRAKVPPKIESKPAAPAPAAPPTSLTNDLGASTGGDSTEGLSDAELSRRAIAVYQERTRQRGT